MMFSDQWGQVPGIVVVAPSFTFFDAADAAKVLEEEVGMYTTYRRNDESLYIRGNTFAKSCIPFVSFWI